MVFGMLKQVKSSLQRTIRRAFLADPEKMPERVAIAMASALFLSIIITYNVLYEKEKRKGAQTQSVLGVFRERSAKEKLEHLELQRHIAQARERTQTTTRSDL